MQSQEVNLPHMNIIQIAMNEYKIQSMHTIEQGNMLINDYQSKIINEYIADDEINKILIKAENPQDMDDAMVY